MKIVNIVASGDLHRPVSFERLPELPAATYNPEVYHGAYILLSLRKATIYRSGKYIIYGLAALDEVDTSYREFLTLISPIIDPAPASPPRSGTSSAWTTSRPRSRSCGSSSRSRWSGSSTSPNSSPA